MNQTTHEPVSVAQASRQIGLDVQIGRTVKMLARLNDIATGKERMVLRDLPHPE